MTATAEYYTDRYRWDRSHDFNIPDVMHLGGTPLNSTLFVGFSVMREFQKKNQVDVINSIFLTDGDSHSSNGYWNTEGNISNFDIREENVVLRDSVSKKSVRLMPTGYNRSKDVTVNLVKFYREVFDINIVNFFLIGSMRKYDMAHYLDYQKRAAGEVLGANYEEINTALRKFRKDKYMIMSEMLGFNEQYLVQGGKALEVADQPLEVAEGATVAQMAKAFKKFSTGKLQNRKLLSRFIDMVAA